MDNLSVVDLNQEVLQVTPVRTNIPVAELVEGLNKEHLDFLRILDTHSRREIRKSPLFSNRTFVVAKLTQPLREFHDSEDFSPIVRDRINDPLNELEVSMQLADYIALLEDQIFEMESEYEKISVQVHFEVEKPLGVLKNKEGENYVLFCGVNGIDGNQLLESMVERYDMSEFYGEHQDQYSVYKVIARALLDLKQILREQYGIIFEDLDSIKNTIHSIDFTQNIPVLTITLIDNETTFRNVVP